MEIALSGNGELMTVTRADGTCQRFHAIWLRDNCQDDTHRHPDNGQRLITVLDIAEDTRIESACVSDDKESVVVRFAPDGHESLFDARWLAAHAYDTTKTHETDWVPPQPMTWGREFGQRLPSADYAQVKSDPHALRDWLGAVRSHGFAILTGTPVTPGTVTVVAELFGHVRETNYGRLFDVVSQISPTNLAYTGLGLQVHTDNPYRDPVPTLQLLHCLASDAEGGDSTVVDGFRAAEILRSEDARGFDLLTRHSVPFVYAGDDGVHLEAQAPMIELSAEGRLRGVRFNNRSAGAFTVPFDDMAGFYAAYRTFATILERPELEVTFKLAPGDLFIVDNRRVMHGRKGYSGSGRRHLQGCYADIDGLLSTLAVLEARTAA